METNFNFKSQVATSIEQSERLLALGLKKETADCVLPKKGNLPPLVMPYNKASIYTTLKIIPAWSLHRLIKLAYENWREDIVPIYLRNSYDTLIGRIEFLVKKGIFNKEYLV